MHWQAAVVCTVRADYYGGDEGEGGGLPCLLPPYLLEPAAEENLTNQRPISRKKGEQAQDSEKKKQCAHSLCFRSHPSTTLLGSRVIRSGRRSALQEIAQKILKSGSIQPR